MCFCYTAVLQTMKLKKALFRKRKKKESRFKHLMLLLHLWLGLLSSIVILIVCLTGCIYVFKNQVNDFYNRDKVFVKAEGQSLPLSAFETELAKSGRQITSVVIPKSNSRSLIISSVNKENGNPQTRFFNPYTGRDLGAGGSLDDFFGTVEQIHKNLLLGEPGKQIVGVFSLIFILMLITGLVLWWPKRNKKQIKEAFNVKWRAKFHRLNHDLHSVFGFYSLIFLLFISITGIYITYPWVKSAILVSLGGSSVQEQTLQEDEDVSDSFAALMDEMLKKEDEKTELSEEKPISLDSIQLLTNRQLAYKGTTVILLPDEKEPRYRVQKINTDNFLGAMLPDLIEFDKKGVLQKTELFKDKPLHQQFKEISKPLHTGEILGLKSVIFYFIITMIGFSLPITGFIIWWKKAK